MAASQDYVSSITSTGQLILPQEVRRVLGLKAQDKVVFRVVKDKVEVMSESAAKEEAPSTAEQVLGSLPGLALEALAAMGEVIRDGKDEAKPKPAAKPKPKPKAKPKTAAKPKAKPKAAAKPKAKPKTTAKPKAKPKSATKPKTTAKPKAKAATKPKTKAAST